MRPPLKSEIRKPTKTISGITPVAVMLPPKKCEHGACVYCPSMNVPQSYTPKSPVVMRARELKYDSFKQVQARLKAFEVMNHPTEKIELIIMGGTFLQYSKKFQYEFIKSCYDGLNNKISKTLDEAKKLNENSKHRCTALCIETRPDVCSYEDIKRIREFGATRVELGVQAIDNKIYKLVNRGHNVKDVVDATKRLKDAGFKVGYHLMPGLPGSNIKKDMQMFKKIFSDEKFKPDQIKIYPCTVMPCSELEKWYFQGKYKPYTKEQLEKLIFEMMKIIPRYCRVMRIMREIPPEYIIAGVVNIDLRKHIEFELRNKNSKIKEIRYREVGFNNKNLNLDLKLKITKYFASKGDEYFLEIINKEDILFGLCRLRIVIPPTHPNFGSHGSPFDGSASDIRQDASLARQKLSGKKNYRENHDIKSIHYINNYKNNKFAIIRELHVYGQSINLGEKSKISAQHKGIGKWLLSEAEKIVKKNECKNLFVISGVGVRDYYKKLGYKLDEEKNYMEKGFLFRKKKLPW